MPKLVPEFKSAWLAALRSGEYEQGKKFLRRDYNEFCCLGVACDVLHKSGKLQGEWQNQGSCYVFMGSCGALSVFPSIHVARIIFGFDTNTDPNKVTKAIDHLTELSFANDCGVTFSDISNVIESEM